MTEDLDGPERRKGYKELFEMLTEHTARIELRVSRFIFRGSIGFAVIGVSSAVALAGFGIVLREQQDQTDQIKDTRETVTRTVCEDTNDRNRNTSKRIIELSDEAMKKLKTEAEREDAKIRRDSTLGLIDALVPVQDCDYLVDLALGKVKPRTEIGPRRQ